MWSRSNWLLCDTHSFTAAWFRNLLFKKPLRLWDIFVFSSQSFTVSWTSLSSSGEQWRSICGSIVIILMMGWGQIFWKLLHQSSFQPFGSGSIIWFDGWRHTGRVRVLRRLRFRSRSLVLEHRAHIAVSQSMLHEHLIRLDVPIWLIYTILSN